ncbi:hypothetical protein OG389_04295 [Streptomyces sp. NBC_00435]|uniref:hypothetical protein n=1 Tax=Streptomyces sp. NBC_00435 TaxID=2903649 RepID=UPI002E1EB9BE
MTTPDQAADFRPTHIVPQEGLPAWESPDLSRPTVPLDAFLPVQMLSRHGEWAEILCANGWSAWVDGRLLVTVPKPPPTGGRPLTRAEDPQPLLARCADALEHYRQAVADLAAGHSDAEGFRRGVRGLRAGVVVDGEFVWLYDATAGRWMFGDGSRLLTYAVASGPGAPPARETPRAQSGTVGGADVQDAQGGPAAASDPAPAPAPASASAAASHEPTRIVGPPGPEAG